MSKNRQRAQAVKKHQKTFITNAARKRKLQRLSNRSKIDNFWRMLRDGTEWIDQLSSRKKALIGAVVLLAFIFLLLIATGPPVKQKWSTGRAGEPMPQPGFGNTPPVMAKRPNLEKINV